MLTYLGVLLVLVHLESLDALFRHLRGQGIAPLLAPFVRLQTWCDLEDGVEIRHVGEAEEGDMGGK